MRCRYLLYAGQTDVAPLVTVVERQHSSRRPHPVLRRLLCGNPVRCRYLLYAGQTDVAPLVTVVERQHSSRRQVSLPTVCRPDGRSSTGNCSRETALLTLAIVTAFETFAYLFNMFILLYVEDLPTPPSEVQSERYSLRKPTASAAYKNLSAWYASELCCWYVVNTPSIGSYSLKQGGYSIDNMLHALSKLAVASNR